MHTMHGSGALHRRTQAFILGLAVFLAAPAVAQNIETVDPDAAIDSDLSAPTAPQDHADHDGTGWQNQNGATTASSGVHNTAQNTATSPDAGQGQGNSQVSKDAEWASENPQQAAKDGVTYKEDDLIGAAEGLFGEGAEGLARLIQKILSEQGEPNAYIVGREGGGAFVLGVRYGSGTLFHKVEGQMPVYWTGPSAGFDVGANAGNAFVLVYNLFDTQELYTRFVAGEGQVYAVGGFTASYLRKGDKVLIPIRVGAGLRLGVNIGYMKFSRKQDWLPF